MKTLLLLFYYMISTSVIYAQNPEWINYNNYGQQILTVVIEGNNVWVGTLQGGLVRLNKTTGEKSFFSRNNSGLPSDDISSIAIDGLGNKWIGTYGGLAKFDGTTWTVYTTSNSGLPSNYIQSIAIDGSGNKWIGTESGLAKYDGTTWTVYTSSNSALPSNSVRSIAIDSSGNKWIGTISGLAKFDGTTWTVYTTSNSGLPDNIIWSIGIDGFGNKWIGAINGNGGGLAKFDGTTWTVYTTSNSGLPSNDIRPIAIDGSGNKWIGTYNNGLAKFDGTTWTVYTTSNSGLPSDYIQSITIDGSGNKWIGTGNGGLAVYKEGGIVTSVKEIANKNIPKSFVLFQNYPNPFNPFTNISFNLPTKSYVSLKVFDLIGREVATLAAQEMSVGNHSFQWNAASMSSGVYFYRLQSGTFNATKKLILLK